MANDEPKLPDTTAEVLDKEAEEALADKDTPASAKAGLIGNILTTSDARHEADLESEDLRQGAQRQANLDAEEEARKKAADAAPTPPTYKDIRDPEPKE